MAINPISSSADRTAQTAQSQNAAATEKAATTNKSTSRLSAVNEMQAQFNARIVETSLSVSLKTGNKAQSLVYRSVLDSINETMKPELNNPVQNGGVGQVDTSAEATAERILSFATGFFDSYAKQHPGKDPDKLAEDFVSLVRGGFEKGFKEAKDILDGLGVLGGSDIEKDIMKTYELVSKGFDDFLASKLKPKEDNDVGTQPVTAEVTKR